MRSSRIPPNQHLIRGERWPFVGERSCEPIQKDWSLQISGLVQRPWTLNLDELARLPQSTSSVDIHCVTRWTKLDVRFRGVLLSELLSRVAIQPAAKFVSFVARSARKHSSSLLLDDAIALGTMLATAVDGRPIPPEHGGPLRGIVPGRYFYKSVKWVEQIELLAENRLGFWESMAGYHDHADPWLEERYVAANIDRRRARQLIESKNFLGQDLRGIDCRERDLSNLNARDALLRDADFSRSRLAEADFSGANLSNAKFATADLRGARFINADLEGAELAGADLRGADFTGCSWFGTSLCKIDDATNFTCGATFDSTTRIDQSAIEQLTDDQRRFVEEERRRTADERK